MYAWNQREMGEKKKEYLPEVDAHVVDLLIHSQVLQDIVSQLHNRLDDYNLTQFIYYKCL